MDTALCADLKRSTQFNECMGKYNGMPIVFAYTPYILPFLIVVFVIIFNSNIFNNLLKKFGYYSEKTLKECIETFNRLDKSRYFVL